MNHRQSLIILSWYLPRNLFFYFRIMVRATPVSATVFFVIAIQISIEFYCEFYYVIIKIFLSVSIIYACIYGKPMILGVFAERANDLQPSRFESWNRRINEIEYVTAYLICFALLVAPRSKLNGSKKV